MSASCDINPNRVGERVCLKKACVAALVALALFGCGPSGEFAVLSTDQASSAQPALAAEQRLPAGHSLGSPSAPALAGGDRASPTEYRISPQDIVDVTVYQVPDLNRSVQVDSSGMVGLPLLGAVRAGGRTVRELEADIARRLGERYLQSPQVAVFVKDAAGLRVTIDGAVRKPGIIQIKGSTTLLAALAEAQGFTETADQSGVMIFRPTDKGRTVARFDANAIRSGGSVDPAVYGGDTIVVDESTTRTAWKVFREALPITNIYRFF